MLQQTVIVLWARIRDHLPVTSHTATLLRQTASRSHKPTNKRQTIEIVHTFSNIYVQTWLDITIQFIYSSYCEFLYIHLFGCDLVSLYLFDWKDVLHRVGGHACTNSPASGWNAQNVRPRSLSAPLNLSVFSYLFIYIYLICTWDWCELTQETQTVSATTKQYNTQWETKKLMKK